MKTTTHTSIKVEEAFLKVQADIEWIYVISFDSSHRHTSIRIYRTSNPWTEVDFVFPVLFAYVKFLPENPEDILRRVESTAEIILRALAAYERASKR